MTKSKVNAADLRKKRSVENNVDVEIMNTALPSQGDVERMDYRINRKSVDGDENVDERKRAIQFRKLKEILMQNVGKNGNYSFMRYTKDLIRRYFTNPYTYQNEIREVSRYLYRTNTLYRKIILYYACMPTFNYNITLKTDVTKEANYITVMKEYQKVMRRLNAIDINKEFINMMISIIRDGVFYGYFYNFNDDGGFIQPLDPRYCKISGMNEGAQWVVYFDASYFAMGDNVMFVEPTRPGDTTGLWAECFINGWKAYKEDKRNNRWFMLPCDKTICAIAGDHTELMNPLPFFAGIMPLILDVLDYEQLTADRALLENYVLLISRIPLIDKSDRVDDFAVSLELVQEMQALIEAAVPELVGVAYSPLPVEKIDFTHANDTHDVDMISNSINNVFAQAGATQTVVSSGASSSSTALRLAIVNDASTCFMFLEKLESNFNYLIKRNYSEHITFKIHRQTWFNKEDFIKEKKDAATLGGSALDYLTSLDLTPWQAWTQTHLENLSGIKEIMRPLMSSYNYSFKNGDNSWETTTKDDIYNPDNVGGRPLEDEVSEKGDEARDEGRVKGI